MVERNVSRHMTMPSSFMHVQRGKCFMHMAVVDV